MAKGQVAALRQELLRVIVESPGVTAGPADLQPERRRARLYPESELLPLEEGRPADGAV